MNNNIEKIRHSLSHLMAMAVLEIFPNVKFGIGPIIDDGFYYDFDIPRPLTPEDLQKIERRIKKLIKQNIKFEKISASTEEAKKISSQQPYKIELIRDLVKEKKPITYYKSDKFTDLCSGPHVISAKEINPEGFKLMKVAGAYWRGDEKNPMLQRIYGVAFEDKKQLDDYLKLQEELKKRDHRKLGKELELFSFHDVSPGAPFWHPHGMIMIRELESFWRQIHDATGYQETSTPILNKKELWEQSGHWQHYSEDMFRLKIGEHEYALKPMNCPDSTFIYNARSRSYRDLPIRLSEIGRLHRDELTGALGGLFRVRQITMDDAHIYCRPDQIEKEITGVIKLIKQFYKIFNFDPEMVLSTMPKNHIGDIKSWEYSEKALINALLKNKIKYVINKGDGAFYGPKIDVIIHDSLGREWQMATIQLDSNIPKRFGLTYTDEDGQKQTPIIIHRAIFGSFERFMGILIEHYAGNFPVWLSPVQIDILTVGKAHKKFATKLNQEFLTQGIRSELNDSNETVGYKIRNAVKQKTPYMLVIGDQEMKSKSLNVRLRGSDKITKMTSKKLVEKVLKEITKKQ
ncbi:MAG: threonine--tRNA ligase [bacterium]|nr:threonine--tRNA ligase [bacterium]